MKAHALNARVACALSSWIVTLLLFTSLVAMGCGGEGGKITEGPGAPLPSPTADDPVDGARDAGAPSPRDAGDGQALVAARPFYLKVPKKYDGSKPTPLVVMLHGYGGNAKILDAYFGMSAYADEQTFLLAGPDGTVDRRFLRFWNAGDACCNFYGSPVDDVAYFHALVDDVSARFNVDPRRIFVVGHSNGAFMALRLACEASSRIAGVVSLAGSMPTNPALCAPSSPVAVLQVQGDKDDTISYRGGQVDGLAGSYVAAHETVSRWAQHDGCRAGMVPSGTVLDLAAFVPGAETRVDRFEQCAGGAVELWTIQGGGHSSVLKDAWPAAIYGFLLAHPKP